jgi:hypothetical protein
MPEYFAYIEPIDRRTGLSKVTPTAYAGGYPDHGGPVRPGRFPGDFPGMPTRPTDPGYGVEEGGPDQGFDPNYPSQGLPGRPGRPPVAGRPERPERPERPTDPGFGWGGGERPGHLPSRPHLPTDPSWGVGEDGSAQLPVWPLGPEHGLPPIPGHPLPPTNPPPGTIWPPLPPGVGTGGKTLILALISGVGHRYVVIDTPTLPERPGTPGSPEHPNQGLPSRPEQGLPPPIAQPKK